MGSSAPGNAGRGFDLPAPLAESMWRGNQLRSPSQPSATDWQPSGDKLHPRWRLRRGDGTRLHPARAPVRHLPHPHERAHLQLRCQSVGPAHRPRGAPDCRVECVPIAATVNHAAHATDARPADDAVRRKARRCARVYFELPEPLNVAYANGALAGLRTGEVFALKWEHVDLATRRIHVRESVAGPLRDKDSRVVPVLDAPIASNCSP